MACPTRVIPLSSTDAKIARTNMPTANIYHLERIVGPLNTVTDEEAASIRSHNDETGLRKLIRQLIVPEFGRLTEESAQACKDSLRYFLSVGSERFYEILSEQQEFPIPPPDDPQVFFQWIWGELFHDESLDVADPSEWTVENDPSSAAMRYR